MDVKAHEMREDFKAEPRDLMVVVQDFIKEKGVSGEEPQNGLIAEVPFWNYSLFVEGVEFRLEHRIEDEYNDVLLAWKGEEIVLRAEDNTFKGVQFARGDASILEKIFECVKTVMVKEGAQF